MVSLNEWKRKVKKGRFVDESDYLLVYAKCQKEGTLTLEELNKAWNEHCKTISNEENKKKRLGREHGRKFAKISYTDFNYDTYADSSINDMEDNMDKEILNEEYDYLQKLIKRYLGEE